VGEIGDMRTESPEEKEINPTMDKMGVLSYFPPK